MVLIKLTMLCLDRLCEQKDFFKDLIENRQPFTSACKNHTSKSSAKMIKNALVQPKRKVISKSILTYLPEKAKTLTNTSERKIHLSSENRNIIVVSFAKKWGHFARNCPNKSAKVVRLIQHLQKSSMLSDQEDVESNFSEQIEYDDHTTFILTESTNDSEIDEISVISNVQEVNQVNSYSFSKNFSSPFQVS